MAKKGSSQAVFSIRDSLINLKNLPSTLGLILGLLYTIGFLITNIHLGAKYGIYDYSLVKVRYIYVGAIFLLCYLMALFDAFVILKVINLEDKKTLKGKVVSFFFAVFTFFATSSISSFTIRGMLFYMQGWKLEAIFIPSTFWFWAAVITSLFYIWYLRQERVQNTKTPPLFLAAFITVNVIVLTALYSILCYQFFPASLGGGKPIPVKIIISEDSKTFIPQIVPFEDKNVSRTIYLIDKGSKYYFFLIRDPIKNKVYSVEIAESLIVGIIHPIEASTATKIK